MFRLTLVPRRDEITKEMFAFSLRLMFLVTESENHEITRNCTTYYRKGDDIRSVFF
jgi:hypothetical protein